MAVPARGAAIDVVLWYPAGTGGTPERFGASKVFDGVAARRDASVADGQFPLVVLAHGGLRANPGASGWIAAALAARRYIVAVAQPPRLGPDDARRAVGEVWRRPADLSDTLTAVEGDATMAPHLEHEKVGAVGFFLGGTSALALAGARLDEDSYRRSCDPPARGPDCRWLAESGVDLHGMDLGPLAASHLDRRIKVAVAVDPELGPSLASASLRAIQVPVTIIGLGRPDAPPPRLAASDLARMIPDALYQTVPDATMFSAFDRCTPQGAAILGREGDGEAICRDGGDRSRQEIHVELAGMIASALARVLRSAP